MRPLCRVLACLRPLGLALLLAASAVSAQDRLPGALRVAAELGAPPKWLLQDGLIAGYCPALLQALREQDAQLTFALRPQSEPQLRLESDLAAGKLDLICGLTRLPGRELLHVYVEPPIYHAEYTLIARRDDAIEAHDWDEVRELGDKGIVLLNHDSSRIPMLKALGGLKLLTSGVSTEANLRMLLAGRGRFFYFPHANAMATARALGLDGRLRVLQPPLQIEPYYLLLGRHVPVAQRERLQRALAALAQSGQLRHLDEQWMQGRVRP